jgi:ornithine cyclodeaminase/alanine dehydrogenase-like protein (mu-crystallin family)
MSQQLEIDVVAVDDPREAARGAGIVLSVNNARVPVMFADWLEPGMHVCAISPGQTDEEQFFARVDRWVAHHRLTSMVFRASDGDRAPATSAGAGELALEQVPTLADVLCGRVPGRTRREEITYFGGRNLGGSADDSFGSSGTGVQFSALGQAIYQRAKAAGVGREIPTDWFFETLHP